MSQAHVLFEGYILAIKKTSSQAAKNKRKKKQYCVVFERSNSGVQRIELYKSADAFLKGDIGTVIVLTDCVAVKQISLDEQHPMVQVLIPEGHFNFLSEQDFDVTKLRDAISCAAFPDQPSLSYRSPVRSLQAPADVQELYDVPWDTKQVAVELLPGIDSRRVGLSSGEFSVGITPACFMLSKDRQICMTWPFSSIMQLGCSDSEFFLELLTHETFEFRCYATHTIVDRLFAVLPSVRVEMYPFRKQTLAYHLALKNYSTLYHFPTASTAANSFVNDAHSTWSSPSSQPLAPPSASSDRRHGQLFANLSPPRHRREPDLLQSVAHTANEATDYRNGSSETSHDGTGFAKEQMKVFEQTTRQLEQACNAATSTGDSSFLPPEPIPATALSEAFADADSDISSASNFARKWFSRLRRRSTRTRSKMKLTNEIDEEDEGCEKGKQSDRNGTYGAESTEIPSDNTVRSGAIARSRKSPTMRRLAFWRRSQYVEPSADGSEDGWDNDVIEKDRGLATRQAAQDAWNFPNKQGHAVSPVYAEPTILTQSDQRLKRLRLDDDRATVDYDGEDEQSENAGIENYGLTVDKDDYDSGGLTGQLLQQNRGDFELSDVHQQRFWASLEMPNPNVQPETHSSGALGEDTSGHGTLPEHNEDTCQPFSAINGCDEWAFVDEKTKKRVQFAKLPAQLYALPASKRLLTPFVENPEADKITESLSPKVQRSFTCDPRRRPMVITDV